VATEISNGSFSLYRFFVRRARRLLPALFVCLVIVTLLAGAILLPDAYWYYGRSLLSVMRIYSNVFFYHSGGYFSAPDLEKPLLHTWSLAVEDQFYLTWPLFFMLAAHFASKRAILVVVLFSLAGSLWFAETKVLVDREFAFFMLSTRAWELLSGVALALAASRIKLGAAASEALAVGGMISILASFFLLTPDSNVPGLAAVPVCCGTLAIIVACMSHNVLLRRALSFKPIVFIGLISYSLYLWHWPLLALASYRLERSLHAEEAFAIVLISLVLAALSWRWIEKPFRVSHRLSNPSTRTFSDRQFIVAALSSVVVLVALGGTIKGMKGFPGRYAADSQRVLTELVDGNPVRMACDNYQNVFAHEDICNFGKKRSADGAYEIALFGDSMADHWTPLVAKYAKDHGLSGRQVTNGGCVLLFGVPIPAGTAAKVRECASYQTAAKKFIERNPHLKIAVISGFWEKWLHLLDVPAENKGGREKANLQDSVGDATPDFDKALENTVRVFTDRGIKVVLIGQIPTYDSLPVRCIISAVEKHLDASQCGMSRTEALNELRSSNAALSRIAAANPNVSVSLPSDYMCQQERCSPMMNGVLLYKNGGHVNVVGSRLLERYVKFPEIDAAPMIPRS
jgi:peptidoglycan/LPS O-acetylase OafA/YrhL